ncbi:chaperonin 10-like protein [Mrakia frigida]|uniref:chaperonin 10-like protein n=1 Tax=Mrakia frigida TaxID=29902 RepID=UPI003FCC24F1
MTAGPIKTMQAVVYGGTGIITVEERPIPVVEKDGDVIVRVLATALCGSDLHLYRGAEEATPGFIMGHEWTGIVTDAHPSVVNFKIGDRVVSPFTTNCGSCFFCDKKLSSRCVKSQLFGSPGLDGGQAGYVRCPLGDSTLILAPPDLPEELLVTMGDIMPTGHHASMNALTAFPTAEDRASAIVVVIGCGPVGICAITSSAEWVSKGNLFAIDGVQERLDQAARHGAIPINLNNVGAQSALEIIKGRTEGRGADAILEIVGNKSAYDLALSLIRPFGFISSVGVHSAPSLISGPQAYDLNLRCSFGRCPVRSTFPEALEVLRRNKELFLAQEGAEPGSGFVSHWMDLKDAAEAYRLFENREVRKVVFRPAH